MWPSAAPLVHRGTVQGCTCCGYLRPRCPPCPPTHHPSLSRELTWNRPTMKSIHTHSATTTTTGLCIPFNQRWTLNSLMLDSLPAWQRARADWSTKRGVKTKRLEPGLLHPSGSTHPGSQRRRRHHGQFPGRLDRRGIVGTVSCLLRGRPTGAYHRRQDSHFLISFC